MKTLNPLSVNTASRPLRPEVAGVRLLFLGGDTLSAELRGAFAQASDSVTRVHTVEEARNLLKEERFEVFLFVAELLDGEGESLLMEAQNRYCASIALIDPYEAFLAEGWRRKGYIDGAISTSDCALEALSKLVAEVGKSRISRFVVPSAVHHEPLETSLEKLDRLSVLPYALPVGALAENSLWAELADTAKALRREALVASPDAPGAEQKLDFLLRALARETRFLAPQREGLRQYLCAMQNSIQVFPVADVINETLDMLEPLWERDDILLRCRVAPRLPVVRANRRQLQQSLVALLLNAVEALGEAGGALTLTAEPEWDSAESLQGVCITLKDNGRGMEPEVLAKARQACFTTKASREAAGMGMTFADAFVRSARGRLGIESEPGRGTAVALRLPALHASTQDTTLRNLFASVQSSRSRVLAAA